MFAIISQTPISYCNVTGSKPNDKCMEKDEQVWKLSSENKPITSII